MINGRLVSIALITLLLSACANWQEQDRLARQYAMEQRMADMMEQHQNQPAASGPRWQIPNRTAEAYLARMEELARRDSETLLEARSTVDCTLDEASETLLIHQVTPQQLARQRANLSPTLQQQYLEDGVTVLSGNCEQGRLEGAFSAVFFDRYRTQSQYYNSDTRLRGRIDGYMRDGRLAGEVRTIKQDTSTAAGSENVSTYYSLGVYENGAKVGTHVTLAVPGSGGSVRYVTQVLEQGVHRLNTWMNGKANTRFHMRDGKNEGWMDFASAALKGQRDCYRNGQKLNDGAYCQTIQPKLEKLSLREADPGHRRL